MPTASSRSPISAAGKRSAVFGDGPKPLPATPERIASAVATLDQLMAKVTRTVDVQPSLCVKNLKTLITVAKREKDRLGNAQELTAKITMVRNHPILRVARPSALSIRAAPLPSFAHPSPPSSPASLFPFVSFDGQVDAFVEEMTPRLEQSMLAEEGKAFLVIGDQMLRRLTAAERKDEGLQIARCRMQLEGVLCDMNPRFVDIAERIPGLQDFIGRCEAIRPPLRKTAIVDARPVRATPHGRRVAKYVDKGNAKAVANLKELEEDINEAVELLRKCARLKRAATVELELEERGEGEGGVGDFRVKQLRKLNAMLDLLPPPLGDDGSGSVNLNDTFASDASGFLDSSAISMSSMQDMSGINRGASPLHSTGQRPLTPTSPIPPIGKPAGKGKGKASAKGKAKADESSGDESSSGEYESDNDSAPETPAQRGEEDEAKSSSGEYESESESEAEEDEEEEKPKQTKAESESEYEYESDE